MKHGGDGLEGVSSPSGDEADFALVGSLGVQSLALTKELEDDDALTDILM